MQILLRLKIRTRLFLTVGILLIPIIALLSLVAITQNRAIQFGKKEIKGIHYGRVLWDFHRQLTMLREDNQLNQSKLNDLMDRYPELVRQKEKLFEGSELTKTLNTLNQYLINSTKEWEGKSNLEKRTTIDEIIHLHLKTIGLTGDISNLILDPDLDSYYLMDITLLKLPAVLDKASKLQERINFINSLNDSSESEKFALLMEINQLDLVMEGLFSSLSLAYKYNSELKTSLTETEKKTRHSYDHWKSVFEVKDIKEFLTAKKISKSKKEYEEFLIYANEIYIQSSIQQEKLIQKRISNYQKEQLVSFTFVLLSLFLSFSALIYSIRSVVKPLKEAGKKFEKLAEGDIRIKFDYPYNDEIGILYGSIDRFLYMLLEILKNLRLAMDKFSHQSHLVQEYSENLSLSSQNQASSSEESSASMEEVSSSFEKVTSLIHQESTDIQKMVKVTNNITDSIRGINDLVEGLYKFSAETRNESEKSRNSIFSVTESMEKIHSITQEITGITHIISEISEQTDLLALNAAIEAARAGELGRGFAIVAQEISKLSDRTNESVKNIKKLVDKAEMTVRSGVDIVSDSVQIIQKIGESVEKMNHSSEIVLKEITSQYANIENIQNSFLSIANLSKEIESSSREEKLAINQITEGIQIISLESGVVAEKASELRSISFDLKLVANQGNEALSKLKF
ncbi:MAG: methyl-accepting chemotaxis protein [Leptospira sp.]|nr:methyl-accepting chemotaxis protein [Leptospira sp.]